MTGYRPAVEIVTLASRPDLVDRLCDFPNAWPDFMLQDPTADLYYTDAETAFPE